MTPGQRLKQARTAQRLSRRVLAEKSGVAYNSILQYEHDKVEPSLFAATCLADALGISLDWIAGRTKDT